MLHPPCRLSTTRKYSVFNMICMVILKDYIHNSKVITTLYFKCNKRHYRKKNVQKLSLERPFLKFRAAAKLACGYIRPLPFPARSHSPPVLVPPGARDVSRERRHISCETFYRLLYSQATGKKKLSVFIIKMAFKSIM